MSYYNGNTTGRPGLLPFPPYYWWESGALWGGMLDYSHYTGDPSYDTVIGEGILAQASPTIDFMMQDQRFDLGNDDQVFWAMTAMTAAEHSFPIPQSHPSATAAIWYQLGRNVFQNMVSRWNTTTCGGGLKWQFIPENNGFNYKSTITNAGFFQVAARLARFTGNATFAQWADKSWDWMESVGFVDKATYAIYDGAGDLENCTGVNHDQWSYNAAASVLGTATMWNITGDPKWKTRTQGIVQNSAQIFFSPYPNATGIMYEHICELKTKDKERCDTDQISFKAYVARWFAKAAILCPDVVSIVFPLLKTSAQGAANSCTGELGTTCGTKWYMGSWDGTKGVGQQMGAMEVLQSLLVTTGNPPVGVPGKGLPGIWMNGVQVT